MHKIPSPAELGLPDKFKRWRSNQEQAIRDVLESKARFIIQQQEPGSGKSVTYVSQSLILGLRTAALTASKGLQDQLLMDFSPTGLVDIRGKSSYSCDGLPGHTCDDGLVAKCPYKGSTCCPYYNALYEAQNSKLLTTNYACWIAQAKTRTGLGTFDLLVMDEAHNAPKELAQAMQVTISENEIKLLKSSWPSRNIGEMAGWKRWAAAQSMICSQRISKLQDVIESSNGTKPSRNVIQDYKQLRRLDSKLTLLGNCKPDKWILEEWNYGYQFDPIDASDYAEKYLFRNTSKVVMTSGTINRRTVSMLGIAPEEYEYFSYPGNTDTSRSPFIYIPTVKVWRHTADWEMVRLVKRIDEIFEMRVDRKGIIHTVSGWLRDIIMSKSRYSRYFISNYSKQGDLASEVVNFFKSMKPPAVLVSPSLAQGYDFPYDDARYQIAAKIPWPDSRSRVEQARVKLDKRREAQICMTTLAQMFGRAGRADDDWQEFFCLDDSVEKFLWYNRDLAPPRLMACYRKLTRVPDPPPMED